LDINGSLKDVASYSEYIGIDIKEGKNVDVVLNAHDISKRFNKESFDIVSCSSMLNSDPEFWVSIENMRKVLKKHGLLLITVPGINFRSLENYPTDYYRFTIDVFKDLFFKGMEVLDIQNVYDGGNLCTIVGAATARAKKKDTRLI
jgi:predicted SAM-dependent methyltransferase